MKLRLVKPTRNLEESFNYLLEKSKTGPLSIKELLEIFSGRTRLILIGICCIPFCFPISIPGLSLPFGLLIGFLALEILIGIPLLLPKKIKEKEIGQDALKAIGESGLKVVRKLKPFIRPRWTAVSLNSYVRFIGYLSIPFLALLLALPIPLPFSNMPYSWPILLISIGLIEDDGLFLLIGITLGIISIVASSLIAIHLIAALL